MRYFMAACLAVLMGVGVAQAAQPRDPYSYFFNESFGNFADELDLAREEGKKGIMIFFEMDECPFCHYMKENVLNQPEIQEYYRKNFLLFTVDIEGDIEITDFEGNTMSQKDFAFEKNRVRATPVIAFYDLQGKPIHRHTGRTAGVDEFMWMGEYVAHGVYKEEPFTRFKRDKRREARRH